MLTAPEWSESGRIKVERAEKHIGDLNDAITAFMDTKPYSLAFNEDREADIGSLVVRVSARPRLHFGAIAGDAIHNLRSALDYLWRYAWYPGGGGRDNYSCAFPIMDSSDAFERSISPNIHGRKKRIVDLARAFRPYKGGNDDLWRIKEVNDSDKHRLLIPAYSSISAWEFSPRGRHFMDWPWGGRLPVDHTSYTPQEPICPVDDGAELLKGPIDAMRDIMDMEPKFTLQIAFGEGEAVKGKAMVPTLYRFLDLVQEIAEAYLTAGLIR